MARYVDSLGGMLTSKDEEFRSFLHYTSRNVQRRFTSELDTRNYLATLKFDHKNQKLNIIVNPDSKAKEAALDIETLSGGEKSYYRFL